VMVKSLALLRAANAAIRIITLPSSPNPSSIYFTHRLSFFHSNPFEHFSALDY
jgi:hypothetical protein